MGAIHRRHGRAAALRKVKKLGLSRRDFLRAAGWAAATPLLAACGNSVAPDLLAAPSPAPTPSPSPAPVVVAPISPAKAEFLHGVASGDPLVDRVILWTRVSPDASAAASSLKVDWLMSLKTDLSAPVAIGSFVTSAARDFTVKVDAGSLKSYTSYYYQFSIIQADGKVIKSPIGRTKTAPKAGDTDRLRLVSASCSNYTYGYFNGYAAMAVKKDIDVMLFLGDYIYETGGSSTEFRAHSPAHEILTLTDYRQRHAQYKTDPDLQAVHRQIPWINVWDDHETTDNSYRTGANNHTEGTEGCWEQRMSWAIRAFYEWMPIRDNSNTAFDGPRADGPCKNQKLEGYLPEGNGKIQRTIAYGDLADFIMLDTRLAARDVQNGTNIISQAHTILGDAQRAWFLGQLSASKAKWKIVGQQVTFAPIKVIPVPESAGNMNGTVGSELYLNSDAWDGYRYDRNAVMKHIGDNKISNVVFLSGDTHVVTAFDVPVEPSDPTQYNPVTGAGSLAVEFSNNAIANVGIIGENFQANNPHLKYDSLGVCGYLLLDITKDRVQGEYYFTPAPQVRSATETFQRALYVSDKANLLTTSTSTSGSAERPSAAALAP